MCRISNQRTLLCIAASKGLHVEHKDVKTAFVKAPVGEDVQVLRAPGIEDIHPVTGKRQGATFFVPQSDGRPQVVGKEADMEKARHQQYSRNSSRARLFTYEEDLSLSLIHI